MCAQSAPVIDCGAMTTCGSLCVDPQSDSDNCGACGTQCPVGQACVSSKCSATCPGNEAICTTGGKSGCVNTKSDNANCGACGKACKATEACVGGACSTSCAGKTFCVPDGGAPFCTDTKSDNANCGSCGKKCNATEACVGGICTGSCTMDQTLCGVDAGAPYCANLATDNANCGDCNVKCGVFESCVNGMCVSQCSPLQKLCMGMPPYCADTLTDNANCGTCGTVCPQNKPICVGGQCSDNSQITALICGAPATPSWNNDVQSKLMATNAFLKVDIMACNSMTPTLVQLQQYQSVLVYSDSAFQSPTTLGDNLADYVAGGGYAVVAVFATCSNIPISGKWTAQGYNLIQQSPQSGGNESSPLQIVDAMSPLVVGVSTLTTSSGYKSPGGAVNGGIVVAKWGSGAPLIVRGVKNGRNRAEINMYPPSATVRNDFWSGDGAKIMKNALTYR